MTDCEKRRLTSEELESFKTLLLNEKRKVLGDQKYLTDQTLKQTIAGSAGELSHYSNHLGDTAALSYEREFAMTLSERQAKYLEQIDDALLRIEDKTYGVCMMTGKLIPTERLEAVLVAKYSVEGKALLKKQSL